MHYLEDQGLPLVQLKEQLRELLIVALSQGAGHPITKEQIAEIAFLQRTIAAM